MNKIQAFFAAATFIFFPAFITLYKKQMTCIINAIDMRISSLTALMAMSNDFIGNSFSQSLIKNKILSVKFIFNPFCFYFIDVINNSPFKMKNIFKSFVQHE